MALEINDSNFNELIINSGKPAIVDFTAAWCGPCRAVSPIIEELSIEYADKAVIGKVDVDSCPEITSKFGIRNIPTILFFKNGEIIDKLVGAASKQVFTTKLTAIL